MAGELALQQKLGYVDPAAVAAAESVKAMVQARFIMALQKPRDFDQARDAILTACRRPAFAEKAEFSVKRGSKYNQATRQWEDNMVKGPSIRFAELALREWRNCSSEIQVIYEDADTKRIRVMVLDLETNAAFSKEIAIKKIVERKKADDREVLGERTNSDGKKVYIVRATEDEIQNKENAMISKVIRNEGLRLIPTDIIDEGMEVARTTLRNRDAADPDGAKKKILDAFSSLGIKPAELKKFLGHGTDILSPKETEDLRGIYRAIKDGEAIWADYIESKDGQEKSPETDPAAIEEFNRLVNEQKDFSHEALNTFIEQIATVNKQTPEGVKAQASTQANFPTFWKSFLAWHNKPKPRSDKGSTRKPPETPQAAPEGEAAISHGAEGEGANSGITIGQDAITPGTLASIKEAIGATGIALSRPYEILEIVPEFPLENLGEKEGLEVLAWYKKNA